MRSSEVIKRSSEIFQKFSEVLSETLSEADFPLTGSQSCCRQSCCPLNFLQLFQKLEDPVVGDPVRQEHGQM